MLKKIQERREKRRKRKNELAFTNLSPRAQKIVKTVAVIGLAAIVVVAFIVSFTNLHLFMLTFGKLGMYAVLTAALIDAMTILSLLVALTFRSTSARVGFVLGLLGTAVANATIGFLAAGPVGLAVGLIPVIAMESAYKTVLDLVFTPDSFIQDHRETATEKLETPQVEDLEGLEIMEDTPNITIAMVDDVEESFLKVPELVEEIKSAPVEPTRATRQEIIKVLQQEDGTPPGRPAIMKRFGCSDWVARKVLEELKA